MTNELFGEVISSYSRAQAIEDGVLVDVSSVAREAGIKFPVAMTRTVWGKYVEVPEGVSCQDETAGYGTSCGCSGVQPQSSTATRCFTNSTSAITTASAWTGATWLRSKPCADPATMPSR